MAIAKRTNAFVTARAFATYALVPYLGILFCPGALFMSSVGLLRSYRVQELENRNAAFTLMSLAVVELAAQLTLWWIMYKVPEWSQRLG
ncbi:MAG TPA: hypothetical protein VGN86_04215 [Pyrinomonadaceae bacterium]|nr:hypothetical protein [Pyrinomonadaceae bacterium]